MRTRAQTEAFCQANRLHRIQYYMDEKALGIARDSLTDTACFVISDVFLLHFILFSIRGIPCELGPFCPEHLTAAGAAAVIKQYSLNELDSLQLTTYCGTFPSINTLRAQNIVTALIQAVYPQEPDKMFHILNSQDVKAADVLEESTLRANHNTLIERRYAAERQMIEYIKQGDTRAAIHQLHIVVQDVTALKIRRFTREQAKLGATILRTTVRHAAIDAGLPALVIDRLTDQNAQEVSQAQTDEAINLCAENLIQAVCKVIREAREKRYSALVQNTLYYLEHEYKNEISIDRLAAEFGVSTDHLIASFKKETGSTPNAYLAKVRMKKAANLLACSAMTVGDVSMAVGVSDPNYFVKLFKKEFGETPSTFRKRHTI